MKTSAFIFLACVCLTKAASVEVLSPQPASIVAQENDIYPNGNYSYSFETDDGSLQEQKGILKSVDKTQVLSVQGKYTYKDAEGVVYTISYTADETGYHPVGDSLPVPPPIPDLIAKSLNWIRSHPPAEEK